LRYTVIRTNRKTVALVVESDGSLVVRAPKTTSQVKIDQFVNSKLDWIQRVQERLRKKPAAPAKHAYKPGEIFYFLGQAYPLEIVEHPSPRLNLEGGRFKLSKTGTMHGNKLFTDWYRKEARQVINERVQFLSRKHGYKPNSVRITSARTRWGSCSARQNLNFSYRLVMAPVPVIDYVVIHELVHLKIPNHSKVFWQQVETLIPDYKTRRDWLKKNGKLLTP